MNDLTSPSLESILDTVAEIVKYHERKTEYECFCQVRAKFAEYRRVEALKRAEAQRELTRQIQVWQFKLEYIRNNLVCDTVSQALWTPFCNEVDEYIADLKKRRKNI